MKNFPYMEMLFLFSVENNPLTITKKAEREIERAAIEWFVLNGATNAVPSSRKYHGAGDLIYYRSGGSLIFDVMGIDYWYANTIKAVYSILHSREFVDMGISKAVNRTEINEDELSFFHKSAVHFGFLLGVHKITPEKYLGAFKAITNEQKP